MKTMKFEYHIEQIVNGVKSSIITVPDLTMARRYCMTHKGHYKITCIGEIEYNNGIEVK